jgi:hypothetical protein
MGGTGAIINNQCQQEGSETEPKLGCAKSLGSMDEGKA